MSELAVGKLVPQNPASGMVGPIPRMVNGMIVGMVFPLPLNYIPASSEFPAVCLTSFTGVSSIDEANYPILVDILRAQKLIYLEELTGEATSFAGTAAASVVTLSAGAANEDLCAGLVEWHASNGAYPAVVIAAVTYEVTDVDSVTLEITLGAAPGDGAVTLEVYPHRIAASTTTARLWSWVGKSAIGAGTTETLAMMMRRDQMQGWQTGGKISSTYYGFLQSPSTLQGTSSSAHFASIFYNTARQGDSAGIYPLNDGTNGTPRTGTATHSPDVAVHWYQWAGTYVA